MYRSCGQGVEWAAGRLAAGRGCKRCGLQAAVAAALPRPTSPLQHKSSPVSLGTWRAWALRRSWPPQCADARSPRPHPRQTAGRAEAAAGWASLRWSHRAGCCNGTRVRLEEAPGPRAQRRGAEGCCNQAQCRWQGERRRRPAGGGGGGRSHRPSAPGCRQGEGGRNSTIRGAIGPSDAHDGPRPDAARGWPAPQPRSPRARRPRGRLRGAGA